MKEIIQSYRRTMAALLKRREELCHQRGNCEQRIRLLDFEIEEVEEVLRMLKKYEDTTEWPVTQAG